MKWHPAIVMFLVSAFSLPQRVHSAVIDVMVVYEGVAFNSPDRSSEANAIITNANNALINSGLTHRYNLKYLHTAPLTFTTVPTTTDAQVKTALDNDSQIAGLRQTHAADLVILVTEYLNKTDNGQPHCGVAWYFKDEMPRDVNRDMAFQMAIDRGCTITTDSAVIAVAAHELGHLLHLDHQLNVGDSPDTNPTSPVSYNHPDILQQRATMMVVSNQVCNPGPIRRGRDPRATPEEQG
jgi:hypothetical protein